MNKRGGLGDSPFFKSPAAPAGDAAMSPTLPEPTTPFSPKTAPIEANSVRTDVRKETEPNTSPPRRIKIRHAFNIYADQLQQLQSLELARVRAGKKKKTLSAMVCKALDDFIARETKPRERG